MDAEFLNSLSKSLAPPVFRMLLTAVASMLYFISVSSELKFAFPAFTCSFLRSTPDSELNSRMLFRLSDREASLLGTIDFVGNEWSNCVSGRDPPFAVFNVSTGSGSVAWVGVGSVVPP